MSTTTRIPGIAVTLGFLLAMITCALPSPSHAAWVDPTATRFQVGGMLAEIVPTLVSSAPGIANPTALVNPSCSSQGTSHGGTSLALVRGSKLFGVDPVLYPIVLVVSCLDGGSATIRSRLNFINPSKFMVNGVTVDPGTVVKQLPTLINGVPAAPSDGWAHLVHRPDKGDLLGCGADGSLYRIDYSQTNNMTDGTAIPLPQVATSCAGLAWDAEADMIYQGLTVGSGTKIGRVVRFKDGTTTLLGDYTQLPCGANGLAISGGVLLMSCAGLVDLDGNNGPAPSTLVIQRFDKNTGAALGLYSSISLPVPGSMVQGFLGLTALASDPGLGDLACDPVTFQKDAAGRDLYRDAVWSRRGADGNGVAAVEFPAFTCGLPSNSVVKDPTTLKSFSPLAAGLSTGTQTSPGQIPLTACFTDSSNTVGNIVIDADGDGLPDCWERNQGGSTGPGGIDFDGDGTKDFTLCAQVNKNGDGTTLTTECATPDHKDLFAQVGWMDNHKPDPLALSQTLSPATLVNNVSVGVRSVREAFGAAPVSNPAGGSGISLHIQVDKQPVTITPADGSSPQTGHVTYVALTPCTGAATTAPTMPLGTDAADYDAIKAANFGRFDAANLPGAQALNAMRLAFRYVLFAHNLVGNPNGGSSSSGCSEVGGDDAVVSLGSFTTTTVNGISHARGTTDQQAGTFMHEFGHLLGFEHGGEDTINNKPNYRSVMSYSRQFSGSPITGRRLDYSRSEFDLNEAALDECAGVGTIASDPTLGPILPFFPSADQIAFGPGVWSLVTPFPPLTTNTVVAPCTVGQSPINWNRATSQGKMFQTATSGDINSDGFVPPPPPPVLGANLLGSNDWAKVLYRLSAAIDFAGGRSETLTSSLLGSEMTKENETDFFLKKDVDGNGIGDGTDCGGTITTDPNGVAPPTTSFPCKHRIDIKPSFSFPKTINLGTEATVTIGIFSEKNSSGVVWDATTQVITQMSACPASTAPCLTFSVENVVVPVKTNQNGQGTCSAQNLADPIDGTNDQIKDFKCQFATSRLPKGTHFGVVSGYFVDPLDSNVKKAFSARQEVTIQ